VIGISHTPGINAVPGAVVIGVRRDLLGVQMAGHHCLAGADRIVVRGVDAAFPAVLANDAIVNPDGPALFPQREMVAQVDSCDAPVFACDGRQSRFESGVVVAKRPDFTRPAARLSYVMQVILRGFYFFNGGWRAFPAYRWVTTDLWKVQYVSVKDYGGWLQVFAEALERPQRDTLGAGPDVEVGPDDNEAVFDFQRRAVWVIFGDTLLGFVDETAHRVRRRDLDAKPAFDVSPALVNVALIRIEVLGKRSSSLALEQVDKVSLGNSAAAHHSHPRRENQIVSAIPITPKTMMIYAANSAAGFENI